MDLRLLWRRYHACTITRQKDQKAWTGAQKCFEVYIELVLVHLQIILCSDFKISTSWCATNYAMLIRQFVTALKTKRKTICSAQHRYRYVPTNVNDMSLGIQRDRYRVERPTLN